MRHASPRAGRLHTILGLTLVTHVTAGRVETWPLHGQRAELGGVKLSACRMHCCCAAVVLGARPQYTVAVESVYNSY